MLLSKIFKYVAFFSIIAFTLNSCANLPKLPGADARKYPPDPKLRVKKNLEEGKGFRLMDKMGGSKGNGTFEFASSNVMWRASLDTIGFMPLSSVNYSGGIIITDWYSTDNSNDSIKVSIRFLTNEVRSDALDIKVFNRNCKTQSSCIISEKSGDLIPTLKSKILKTATIYEMQLKDEDFVPYNNSNEATKD